MNCTIKFLITKKDETKFHVFHWDFCKTYKTLGDLLIKLCHTEVYQVNIFFTGRYTFWLICNIYHIDINLS
jgi:hypothetical protein